VLGPVEEVGIAEGDVTGARRHLLPDVGGDRVGLHHEEAPVVHRRDGAVAAQVQAAAAGLDVAGHALAARREQMRVLLERHQLLARRGGKRSLSSTTARGAAGPPRASESTSARSSTSSSPPITESASRSRSRNSRLSGAYSP